VSDAIKRQKGPKFGALRRYEADDRALFNELERIMRDQKMSVSAASRFLADGGRISGTGTPESRAKRLAALYRRERGDFSNR
jgi:hypothetical protein